MKLRHLFLCALALCFALPGYAQDDAMDNNAYLTAFMADFDGASDKLNQLAGAFSDDQYGWRPAEGIRAVSEVFVHVATANIALASALGYSMEMERPSMQEAEKRITSKADVMADLKMSQDHVRGAVKMLMGQDLSGEVSAFGQSMSRYRVLMIIGSHSHEHLGQSIAYARSTGVVPPWSGGG